MGVIEAIKRGFALTGKLMNVVFLFFVFNVAIGLISLPLANPARAGEPGIVAMSVISSILFFLLFIFLQGGALGLVKDLIKTGSASMANLAKYGKVFYLRILGLLLIYIVIAVGVVLLFGLVGAGILLIGDNIVTRSIVAAIVTAAAIAIITFLVYPIYSVVADDVNPLMALKKGVVIAKANFWKTLGLFIVMLLISLAISLIVGFIVGLVTVPLPAKVGPVLIAIANGLVQSYLPIVMMGAFMSFYMALSSGSKS